MSTATDSQQSIGHNDAWKEEEKDTKQHQRRSDTKIPPNLGKRHPRHPVLAACAHPDAASRPTQDTVPAAVPCTQATPITPKSSNSLTIRWPPISAGTTPRSVATDPAKARLAAAHHPLARLATHTHTHTPEVSATGPPAGRTHTRTREPLSEEG
ncbi:hypothetical protein S40288_10978 [Stachybotrys chartarum IBT 40288]|nr:hypothetical protein S40288_10978 [Stachybotrys chartarum IBT 40288]